MKKFLLKLLPKSKNLSEKNSTPWDVEVDLLVSDRDAFNSFVYTDLDKAVRELHRRQESEKVPTYEVAPSVLRNKKNAIIFRQVVTGNYEIRRFASIVESTGLSPVFWEYYRDKFTSNNEWKHSLGKLFFYEGRGKKGGAKIDSLRIVDFNTFNGKPLNSVQTDWGESLVDFHHRFMSERFRNLEDAVFFDASDWFAENGGSASNYYKSFVRLFVRDGILFENFMIDEKELEFTRDIFLPAFIEVWKETGHKPLIVSLEPTDIEDDRFWMCHPHDDRGYIEKHLSDMLNSA